MCREASALAQDPQRADWYKQKPQGLPHNLGDSEQPSKDGQWLSSKVPWGPGHERKALACHKEGSTRRDSNSAPRDGIALTTLPTTTTSSSPDRDPSLTVDQTCTAKPHHGTVDKVMCEDFRAIAEECCLFRADAKPRRLHDLRVPQISTSWHHRYWHLPDIWSHSCVQNGQSRWWSRRRWGPRTTRP